MLMKMMYQKFDSLLFKMDIKVCPIYQANITSDIYVAKCGHMVY